MYNHVFGNITLFHYFASKFYKIGLIHEKYKQAKDNGTLKDSDIHMPLLILHPD